MYPLTTFYQVAYACLDAVMPALRSDTDVYSAARGLLAMLEQRLGIQDCDRKYRNREERRATIEARR